jgi:hypothetical protein
MSPPPSNSSDVACSSRANAQRNALFLAIVAIIFTGLTIPAQTGLLVKGSFYFYLSVASAVVAGILWIAALCLFTKARGYHPLWGLLLLIPPLILFYPFVFPDRTRE